VIVSRARRAMSTGSRRSGLRETCARLPSAPIIAFMRRAARSMCSL
jgi:hypothetical protein